MRRSEFEIKDEALMLSCLDACEFGVLSLLSEEEPYGVALNFAYVEGTLFFHGAKEGRKVDAIKAHSRASFLAVRPYAYIPSYFSQTTLASPATQFFASVHFFGAIELIEEAEVKASALNALMQKYQKEGKYDPVDTNNPAYKHVLEKTGVYKLTPTTWSMKLKVGQNLTHERFAHFIEELEKRNAAGDKETIEMMRYISKY